MSEQRFGALLEEARGNRSCERIARKARYTAQHYRDMERGTKPPPQPEQVLALCQALDVNPTLLVRAALRERLSVELDLPPGRPAVVEFAADVVIAWNEVSDETLWKMRQLLTVRAR